MAMSVNNSNMQEAIQVISERGFDGMREAMRIIFNGSISRFDIS